MIGLPILALTAVLTVDVTQDIDPRERLTMDLGAADAKVTDRAAESIRQNLTGEAWEPHRDRPLREQSQAEIQAVVGSGRIIPMSEGFGEYWNGTDYASAGVREIDLRDPMAAGMFPLVRGRYPQTADEVVVTAFLKAEVGSTIRYTRDDVSKRVVGAVAKQPNRLGIKIIALPGSLIPVRTTTTVENYGAAERSWLVDTLAPITWNEIHRINQAGVTVLSRAGAGGPAARGRRAGAGHQGVVGQQGDQRSPRGRHGGDAGRDRGCAAGRARLRRGPAAPSQGSSRAHLRPGRLGPPPQAGRAGRRADPGLAAAVLGVAGGVGAARAITSYLGVWPLGEMGPFEVPAGQIALVAALGVFSGVAAAVVPAVQAARADVVAALTGRRAEVRDRAGWPLLGLILLVAGVGAMISGIRVADSVVLFGAVIGLLGLVMVTPRLVRLIGGLAGGLPLPFRLGRPAMPRHPRGRIALQRRRAKLPRRWRVHRRYRQRAESVRGALPDALSDGCHGGLRQRRHRGGLEEDPADRREGAPRRAAGEGLRPDRRRRAGVVPANGRSVQPLYDLGIGVRLPSACWPHLLRLLLGRTDRAAETALAEGKMVIFNPKGGQGRQDPPQPLDVDVGRAEGADRCLAAVVATVHGPLNVLGVMPVEEITRRKFTAKYHRRGSGGRPPARSRQRASAGRCAPSPPRSRSGPNGGSRRTTGPTSSCGSWRPSPPWCARRHVHRCGIGRGGRPVRP